MDRQRYRDQFDTLRQAPPSRAAMADDAFVAFTAHDYGRRRRLHPDVAWEDACRAYAFAAASHARHEGHLDLDTELALGPKFDRMAFNDFVIGQGLLPPEQLAEAVRTQFVPAHQKH